MNNYITGNAIKIFKREAETDPISAGRKAVRKR